MDLQAIAMGLAIVLAGAPPLSAHGWRITCGETQRNTSPWGDTIILLYEFTATAGEVYSFRSTVQRPTGSTLPWVELAAGTAFPAYPDSNGEARICGWKAPETGDYHVLQDGYTTWGWDVSLTMYCGSPPAACLVPVTPTTWSHVKALFREAD